MTDKEEIIIDGIDVSGCEHHRKCILPDNIGCKIDDFLCCDKPNCNYKQLAHKTQIIDEVEEVIKPYQEQIELDALSLPIAIESILERKTQECDIWKNQVLVLDEESVTVQVTQEQFEEYQKLKQECEKLSILAQEESARNAYIEYELNDKLKQKMQECKKLNDKIIDMNSIIEDAAINLGNKDFTLYDLPFEIKKLSQECENLKAEEKYLKQCCQKAGEELAKHSFEYDGKEKNLVVQAMELNEKYEKLENALEEIEEIVNKKTETSICSECAYNHISECKDNCMQDVLENILNIINKAKGE